MIGAILKGIVYIIAAIIVAFTILAAVAAISPLLILLGFVLLTLGAL